MIKTAKITILITVMLGAAVIALPATASAASVLDGFAPEVNGDVRSIATQPDGKIVVGGNFTIIGGDTRNHVARLNPDGTLDADFNPNANNFVISLAVQPDGKIIVGGTFTTIGGAARNYIARLNSDGSLDASFNSTVDSYVYAIAVLADGKIVVGGEFTLPANSIALLNPDGSLDATFALNTNGAVESLALQADGKIVMGGGFTTVGGQTRNNIARLNSDGSLDAEFNPNVNETVRSLVVQANGKIIMAGDFSTVGGQTGNGIARLNADGTLDTTFDPNVNDAVSSLALQPDGKILIGGYFTTIGGETKNRIARLNPDGTLDVAFNPNANNVVYSLAMQADGSIVVGGEFTTVGGQARSKIARLNPDGTLDADFEPDANGDVYSIVVQSDGKIVVGGGFTSMSGQARNYICRLNADGALDATFDPDASGSVLSLAIQSDGRILAGGNFTSIGGQAKNRIARLNPDGTPDATFDPNARFWIASLAVQADGRILAGGRFTTIGGQTRNRIARLNPDGTLDDTFDPNASDYVYAIAVQADGKILVGGYFTSIGGQARNRIARLDPDGTLDETFDPNANSYVFSVAVQPDGKILVGGNFTSVGGQMRNNIARLNPDGTLDASFDPSADSTVNSLAVQADGKILVGGSFTTIGGQARSRMARLNPDGTLDESFDPNANAGSTVYSLAVQSDGKVLVGGNFSTIGGHVRNSIARLSADGAALQELAVSEDGASVTWMRGGSSPEVFDVIFEESSDMNTWTLLSAATRTTGGWELTGLSLPLNANHYVRARGRAYSGQYNSSGSRVESVRQFYNPGYTLAVTTAGTGSGTVTSSPSGIDCGADCSEIYAEGKTVDLTATPDAGSTFTGWSGDADCGDGQVTMDADRSCTATFTLNTYTVTPSAGANGSIGPNTAQIVSHGSTTSFTITPDPGYHIDGVTGTCGGSLSGSTYATHGITAACTVTASFAINTYTVTFDLAGGIRTGGGALVQTIAHGQAAVAPVFNPPAGRTFTDWNAAFDSITTNTTVTAQYTLNQYTVNFESNGGNAVGGISADYNTTISAPVDPIRTGYTFAGWYKESGLITAWNFASDTVTSDITLYVEWSVNQHYVTPSAGSGGGISPATAQTVSSGATTTFTIIPNTDYQIGTVTGCGGTLSGSTYTTEAITADCTVTASFTLITTSPAAPTGDLNNDGTVDSRDALKCLRIAAAIDAATTAYLEKGDVAPLVSGTPQPDGKLDIGDVVVILRKAVGLVSW